MTHIKEAMKSGLEKWKEELKKEKGIIRQAWLEHQRNILDSWLQEIESMIDFTENTPHYVPTIKPQWKDAVQPSTTLGDPGQRKPRGPGKPTARKSGASRSKPVTDPDPNLENLEDPGGEPKSSR